MSLAVARHRRTILTAGVAACVAGAGTAALLPGTRSGVFLGFLAALLLCAVAGIAAGLRAGRLRTATLDLSPDGFATRRYGAIVFFGLALPVMAAFVLCALLLDPEGDRAGPGRLLLIAAGTAVLGLGAVRLLGMWRGLGVCLTPAGLVADVYAGTIVVPWEALAAEQPR